MQTFLNTKIDVKLANALTEYTTQSNQAKNAVISIGLLQIIPQHILDKYNVVEILTKKGVIVEIKEGGLVGFKNKHAGKIYNLLSSHITEGSFRISLDNFKTFMEFEEDQYATFGLIKLRVIDPVIREINQKMGLKIKYIAEKSGRSVTSLFFEIK